MRAEYVFYSNNSYNKTTILRKSNSIHKRSMIALTLLFIKTFTQQILLTLCAQFLTSTEKPKVSPLPSKYVD